MSMLVSRVVSIQLVFLWILGSLNASEVDYLNALLEPSTEIGQLLELEVNSYEIDTDSITKSHNQMHCDEVYEFKLTNGGEFIVSSSKPILYLYDNQTKSEIESPLLDKALIESKFSSIVEKLKLRNSIRESRNLPLNTIDKAWRKSYQFKHSIYPVSGSGLSILLSAIDGKVRQLIYIPVIIPKSTEILIDKETTIATAVKFISESKHYPKDITPSKAEIFILRESNIFDLDPKNGKSILDEMLSCETILGWEVRFTGPNGEDTFYTLKINAETGKIVGGVY